MKYIKIIQQGTALTILFIFVSASVMAQQPQQQVRTDFTNEELKSFIKANENVMEIQQESAQKMVKTIEDEGLTVERFNTMAKAQQDPNTKLDTNPKEMNAFNNAAQEIIKQRKEVESEMVSTIEEEGINIQTYQQILIAYQQSQKVKNKVDILLKEEN